MPQTIEQRLKAAGVERILLPMGMADPSMSHVNVWRLGAQVIVDTGKDDADTRTAWQHAGGLSGVTDIICTHGHTDHMGLAHYALQTHGARIHVTTAEIEAVQRVFARSSAEKAGVRARFLHDLGAFSSGAGPSSPLSGAPTVPPATHLPLVEGQVLDLDTGFWRVTLGGGHSKCPALLVNEAHALLVTGDQVLPDTAPFVGVSFADPDADPLADMIAFLGRWNDTDPHIIVLPGHGDPFSDPGRRAQAHLASYERRLARVWTAAEQPITCAKLLPALFRVKAGQPVLDIHYAMAAALLNNLMASGKVERWRDPDGVFRYRRR